jgi:cytochrome c biogenesis protein CcmG/thiol:disulfide interchange protein DsbE
MLSTTRRNTILGAGLAAVILATACSNDVRAANLKPEKQRKQAPEFELKDSMGKSVKLSDYRGKVVLLNFWATWCAPCKIEIPWFVEFEQKHKDQGFAVLGVSMDEEGWEIVKPYVDRSRINYRILLGNDQVAQLYGGVDSLPTSFLLDRQGRVAAVHVGLVGKDEYQNDINQLLGTSRQSGLSRSSVPAVLLGTK